MRRRGHMLARRAILLAPVALACAPALASRRAAAQPAATAPASGGPDRETFLRIAHSSAVLQARAAELAASRDTKPEVRSFARRMVEFRRDQIARLLAAARERTIAVPSTPEFEHRVILENLEPLDFLALSRRYVEVQVQALEQELQVYVAAEKSSDEWVKGLAGEARPQLQRLLDEAGQLRQVVGP